MHRYLLRGLMAAISVSGATIANGGGPGCLWHRGSHHGRHEVCSCSECCQQPLVIHCCPPAAAPPSRYRETARQATATAPALIQASVPHYGFGAMSPMMMPMVMPMPIGVPHAYQQQSYQQYESGKPRQDCCDQLRRLEDDVRQLTRDVDRIVDVVDRHSRVLDRLVDYLDTQDSFQRFLQSNPQAAHQGAAGEISPRLGTARTDSVRTESARPAAAINGR